MKIRHLIASLLLLMACAAPLRAQWVGDTVSVPAFLNKEKNHIDFNGADWSPLFAEMDSLQNGSDSTARVVSIVHIGDSHIQAGYLTEAVRLPLQRRFGDAGRGLVVPLKLAKTNEPHDYSVVADGVWNFSRCVGRKYSAYTPGIGGIAIVPRTNRIDLTVSTLSKTDDCEGFRRVRLFHEPTDSFPAVISEPYRVTGETRSPFVTSGVRLGTPAVTTRGMGEAEMKVIADCIADCIWHYDEKKDDISARVLALTKAFPLYQ